MAYSRRVRSHFIAAAVVIPLVGLACWAVWDHFSNRYLLREIKPLVFVLTDSGRPIQHHAIQAHVTAPAHAVAGEMERLAQDLFESRLKAMADEANKPFAWVTFYIGSPVMQNEQAMTRTYRVIFERKATGWGKPQRSGNSA